MASSAGSESGGAGFPPVVLVEGGEATLREAALAELRERTLGDGPRDFNEDRFDLAAAGAGTAPILAAARLHPLMSPGRLVCVRGLEDRRAARFLERELLEYLDDPSPTTCLVLETAKADRRLKWVKRAVELGERIDCSGPRRPAEARAWVDERLAAAGLRAERGTSAALVELVGADVDRLALEIEKLSLYAAGAEKVGAEDVSAITGPLRELALYELTDQIGGRRLADALQTLGRLLDQGVAPLALLGALANHFRRLVRARECRPLQASVVQERLGLHPFAAKKLAEQAKRSSPRRLRQCLAAVRRTDEALKGAVPLEARLAVERLVLAVCR